MRRPQVLWIEDDRDLVDLVKPLLTADGWEVNTAGSADEGKALAVNIQPDLIVMDVIMPGEHGFNCVEDLTDDPRLARVPVIVFSNVTHRWNETTATREDAVLTEAVAFVDKSGGPMALINSMRGLLGRLDVARDQT